jgi:hypothetical protein
VFDHQQTSKYKGNTQTRKQSNIKQSATVQTTEEPLAKQANTQEIRQTSSKQAAKQASKRSNTHLNNRPSD